MLSMRLGNISSCTSEYSSGQPTPRRAQGAECGFNIEAGRWLCIGGLAPLVGFLGQAASLVIFLTLLAIKPSSVERRAYRKGLWWLSPVLALTASWTLAYLIFALDGNELSWAYRQMETQPSRDPGVILQSLAQLFYGAGRSLAGFLRFLIMGCMIGMLSEDSRAKFNFGRGLVGGGLLSLVVLAVQYFWNVPSLQSADPFWLGLGRPSGLFSDPNALGVGACLLAAIGLSLRSTEGAVMALGWLAMGPVSGSRTFLLGAFVVGLGYLCSCSVRVRWMAFGVVASAGLGLIGLHSLGVGVEQYFPLGVTRAIRSISTMEGNDSLFSRVLFWRMNLAVGADYPLLGVGFQNFSSVVPRYAHWLGATTGAWTDNTNSFYLGVWSETGILGLLAYLWVILRTRIKGGSTRERVGLLGLLLMLATGPHLDFTEISVISSFILSSVLRLEQSSSRRWDAIALTAVSILPLIGFWRSGEYGMYSWESEDSGLYRWTSGNFRTFIDCRYEQKLAVRAITPGEGPVILQGTVDEMPLYLKLKSTQWQILPVQCNEDLDRRNIALRVSKTWSPAHIPNSTSTDPRILGVEVKIM